MKRSYSLRTTWTPTRLTIKKVINQYWALSLYSMKILSAGT